VFGCSVPELRHVDRVIDNERATVLCYQRLRDIVEAWSIKVNYQEWGQFVRAVCEEIHPVPMERDDARN
jgi:hypothetical protein